MAGVSSSQRKRRHFYMRHVQFSKGSKFEHATGYRPLFDDRLKFFTHLEYLYSEYCAPCDFVDKGRKTRLFNLYKESVTKPTTFKTASCEIERMCECVELPVGYSYGDPFAGSMTIPRTLQHLNIISNDIKKGSATTYHFDAVCPGAWPKAMRSLDVYISSPPYELLDVCVPALYERCKKLVILHVPGDWLSNAPPYRRAFISKLQSQHKAALVLGLENINGRRCAWLLLSKNAGVLSRVIKKNKLISGFVPTFVSRVPGFVLGVGDRSEDSM